MKHSAGQTNSPPLKAWGLFVQPAELSGDGAAPSKKRGGKPGPQDQSSGAGSPARRTQRKHMDETLAELSVTNTTTGSRSSWHFVYTRPHARGTHVRHDLCVARHRRGNAPTVLAGYHSREDAELIVDMLSAGGHWYQTGGSFRKSPGTTL